jgi:xylulokinase
MAGERSPIWDDNAKAIFYGLDYSKTKAHMVRAVMEGVAYSLRHNLDVAESAGAKAGKLRAMGGSANSLLWTQIKADVTGRDIEVPSSDTATTLGAALLAGVGIGMYQDFQEATASTVKIKRMHFPDSFNQERYRRGYETYLELVKLLKNLMDKNRFGSA